MKDTTRSQELASQLRLRWHLWLPRELEKDFRQDFIARLAQLVRIIQPLLIAFYLVAMALEAVQAPTVLTEHWRPHLWGFMVLLAICWCAWSAPRLLQPVIAFGAVSVCLCANLLAIVSGVQGAYLYFLVSAVVVLLLTTLLRIILLWALPVIVIIVAAMAASFWMGGFPPFMEQLLLLLTLLVAMVCVIGLYSMERLQRRHFLVEQLLKKQRQELSYANKELTSESREDPLTKVLNRRGMELSLGGWLHRAEQQTPDAPRTIALLLFDIDFFKQFNDTYGHVAGDHCLQQVSALAQGLLDGGPSFVARYGGEEFVVVLVGRNSQEAAIFAERLRDAIEKLGIEHKNSHTADVLTISIGISVYEGRGLLRGAPVDSTSMIRAADKALYEAKRLGRNQVRCGEL